MKAILFLFCLISVNTATFAKESDEELIARWKKCKKCEEAKDSSIGCRSGTGGACNRGLGGPLHDGLGGPLYHGTGGNVSQELGGRCYDGVGGNCYAGLGGKCNPDSQKKECPEICSTICELDKKK